MEVDLDDLMDQMAADKAAATAAESELVAALKAQNAKLAQQLDATEEVAASHPEKIFKEAVHPALGLQPYQARKLASQLGFTGGQIREASKLFLAMYRLFISCDCSMVEINPLVTTPGGEVLALDAKFNFDDNALYRHPEIEALHDPSEEDPREVEAAKYDLNYYVSMGKDLRDAGAHILGLKDMAGLLKPAAATVLVKALKEEVGLPLHFHTHDTSGISAATVLAACDAGADAVDAASQRVRAQA